MEKDNFEARTLAEMPQHESGYRQDRLKFISLSMINSGYHRWGFVIYRCAYGDDDLWNRYLDQFKKNLHNELVYARRAELLEQYLDWVVIEDRNRLDGASKSEVRRHFSEWVNKHTSEAGLQHVYIDMIARFKYCLYIDQKCLDTLEQFQRSDGEPFAQNPIMMYNRPPMVVVVIDRLWSRSLKGVPKKDWGHPPIEGSSKHYVGWLYTRAFHMAALYHELSADNEMDDPSSYARPPGISPMGNEFMPE